MTSPTPEPKKCAECNHVHLQDGSCIGNRNLCQCTTTPEPELNVEADLDKIIKAITGKAATEAFMAINPALNLRAEIVAEGKRFLDEKRQNAKADILALIQQVSDQKVREVEALVTTGPDKPLTELTRADMIFIIDKVATYCADYLSHKEARDE